MTPHAGKVMTHASSMFFAIPQFTRLNDFEAPTPMMADVLQWLVETGMPVRLANRSVNVAREIRGDTLVFLELHHVHTDGI